MVSKFTWAAATAAAVAVLSVAAVVVILWNQLGASQISAAGWLAMILGIIATLALGIGLMTLMYVSNRRGYDDSGGRDP